MLQEKVVISDFYNHEFSNTGSALIAITGDRALISITDAASLVGKDRKQLMRWLLINKVVMFHFAQFDKSLSAIFFDDFIEFCLHEREIADNQNAVNFLAHLLAQENVV